MRLESAVFPMSFLKLCSLSITFNREDSCHKCYSLNKLTFMRNGIWGSTKEEKVALGHFVILFAEDSKCEFLEDIVCIVLFY